MNSGDRKFKIRETFLLGMLLLFVTAGATAGFAQAAVSESAGGSFEKANSLYREEKYGEAADLYRELAAERPKVSAYAFNLGNSLFREKKLGEAILAYERALLTSPRSRDIRDNLAYAKELLPFRIEDGRNWYIRFAENLLTYFRDEEVYFALLAVYSLFMSLWCFALLSGGGQRAGWFRKSLAVICILFGLLAAAKTVESKVLRDAIVMEKEAPVRFGPSLNDQVAFRLATGMKVYVIDAREFWSRVLLKNNESGWVKNSDIALVRDPYKKGVK